MKDITDILQRLYQARCNIDFMNDESTYIVSDTYKAAVNVADNLYSDQSDCEMHYVNLALGYGFGIKEDNRTKQEADETGQMKKVTTIVMAAGAFPDGERVVKASRKIVTFFSKSPHL